ncbi:MAG: hypothetical protein CFE43_06755 [Burkholderiales bacterium PBB3]|nr:MAG: hypothetical protein CFE43_06755 [Burkholderiales bacterium PBB3]
MWKIVVGFVLFAALALFVLSRGGDIDMSGEKHGDTSHIAAPAPAVAAPAAPASAPAQPASAASAPASATK